jgi:hypothetical protein
MDSGIEVPVRIGEHGKLGWYTSILPKPLFSSVLMPLEQKIDEAVFFQRVIRGFFNGFEQPAEGRRISRRPEGVWLPYTP